MFIADSNLQLLDCLNAALVQGLFFSQLLLQLINRVFLLNKHTSLVITVFDLSLQIEFLFAHYLCKLFHSLLLSLCYLQESNVFVLGCLELDRQITTVLEDALKLTDLLKIAVLVQD